MQDPLSNAKIALAKMADSPVSTRGHKYELVCDLYDHIHTLRVKGHAYSRISDTLTKAGTPISSATLKKLYEKITEERETGKY